MNIKQTVRNALYGTPWFDSTREAYQRVFDRTRIDERFSLKRFYSQFFKSGDLVFDIGANMGEYSEAFASAGAAVVAAEPNPACCESLYKLARMRNIRVESCAVADAVGVAEFSICDVSGFSTLNEEWLEKSKASPDYKAVHWTEKIQVPVVTLDNLARRHGIPTFVKVDVECCEDRVLAGMTFQPAFLSFEFSTFMRDVALACLKSHRLDGYEFNAIAGRTLTFLFPSWRPASDLSEWLTVYSAAPYGDIFARKT